jgi:hypothetical protein
MHDGAGNSEILGANQAHEARRGVKGKNDRFL